MIGKICPLGQNVAGLIRYIYSPGRREEHTDPHIIAGYRHPADLEPALRPDGGRDFRRLVGLLKLPHDVLGQWGYAKPVWHCSMRAAPEDRLLSDDEWAQIAHDAMHRTGLAPYVQQDEAVRWIAVRHGPDHIHIVAMLARQDRTRPRLSNDRLRVRDACIAAERRYGLRSTAPADRTANRCPTRAEVEKSARRGMTEPPRIILRRHVATAAAAAGSAEEFFARLDEAGVRIRLRHSARNTGEVTGFSVGLPEDTAKDGEPVWYGGAKLASDLSWPRLCQRWATPSRPDLSLSAEEAGRLWDYAARVCADAAEQVRSCSGTNPEVAADAACAAADALRVAAAALGSRVLRQAADEFDRAARQPYGHIPAPTPVGRQLRQAARLISAYSYVTHDRTFAPLVLIIRLAALAEAVAELRQNQERAAQAAAALRAAQHLDSASRKASPFPPRRATHAPGRRQPSAPESEAGRLAAQSFPSSPFRPDRPSAPAQTGSDQNMPRPPRRPPPPRPRGPTRWVCQLNGVTSFPFVTCVPRSGGRQT